MQDFIHLPRSPSSDQHGSPNTLLFTRFNIKTTRQIDFSVAGFLVKLAAMRVLIFSALTIIDSNLPANRFGTVRDQP
jgi:hypothetical protein